MSFKETLKGNVNNSPFFANNNTIGKRCILNQRYDYIPLDYVKCEIIGIPSDVLMNNENLKFNPVYKNAELTKYTAYYLNLKFTICLSGRIEFSGSLHKFWNNGLHNYNIFHKNALNDVILRLNTLFGLSPLNLRLICLEFGLNIIPPIETKLILNNLLEHKRIDFETSISNSQGHYLQAKHSEYILKIYDKSKQYQLGYDLLRIEIKQQKFRKFRDLGINTLNDFINCDKRSFIQDLINKWDEVIFYNPLNELYDKWDKYSNVNYWRSIRKISTKNHSKHHHRLRQLNSECSLDVQNEISNILFTNINQLQGVTNLHFNEFFVKSDTIKKCMVTGIDISSQKRDSFLLSHTGLKQLFEKNLIEFNRIKNKYLSIKWISEDLDTQIKEIAHNIRNSYYNREKRNNPYQLILF